MGFLEDMKYMAMGKQAEEAAKMQQVRDEENWKVLQQQISTNNAKQEGYQAGRNDYAQGLATRNDLMSVMNRDLEYNPEGYVPYAQKLLTDAAAAKVLADRQASGSDIPRSWADVPQDAADAEIAAKQAAAEQTRLEHYLQAVQNGHIGPKFVAQQPKPMAAMTKTMQAWSRDSISVVWNPMGSSVRSVMHQHQMPWNSESMLEW